MRDSADLPVPKATLHAAVKVHGTWVHAVTRTWHPGDPGRCRRCPEGQCGATAADVCLVLTGGPIEIGEAWAYARPGSFAAGGGAATPTPNQTPPKQERRDGKP